MSLAKIKLFSVITVNFGFTLLNVTIFIIYITGIFKTMMIPGIAYNVAAKFFLSTPQQLTKNFLACCARTDTNTTQWKDVENNHNTSLS